MKIGILELRKLIREVAEEVLDSSTDEMAEEEIDEAETIGAAVDPKKSIKNPQTMKDVASAAATQLVPTDSPTTTPKPPKIKTTSDKSSSASFEVPGGKYEIIVNKK